MKKDKSEEKLLPPRYINRELSWLEFNERVLEEARDKSNPLMERLKFLIITCSNLDEFFMIRVASLKDLVFAGYERPDAAGLAPREQLSAISERTHRMVEKQYTTLNRSLLPALLKHNIRILTPEEINAAQKTYLSEYFRSTVFPILTPMAVDAGRPFPLIANKSLNLCVTVERMEAEETEQPDMAIVQVPGVISRLVGLPAIEGHSFILLEDVIRLFIDRLFSGVRLGPIGCFRIMRNADLTLDEDEATDLLKEIEKQLKMRQWGEVIRLETDGSFESPMLQRLVSHLQIDEQDIFRIDGPIDLTGLNSLTRLPGFTDLHDIPFQSQPAPNLVTADLFAAIRQKDIFLHHPYESFDPIAELIRSASVDPDVLAIKQTLYRVSGNSPIIRSLAAAAERGKQVMVLVELKARFDEENNILWARELERAGCHVIYGLVGLKTHSKITLIVRRDDDAIRRYVHLGTGNYNDITARLYTDMGLLTCSESIGADASAFFNMLSGYSAPSIWRKLTVAPYWLRRELEKRIDLEADHARQGRKARIIAKVNALADPAMIDHFYAASQAGVKIDLIVRGICCLRPGVPGLSDNIEVRSIVGRFLEHSRIFYFLNDGQEDLFLASADLMPRNLDRRIELMFPIDAPDVHRRIMEVIDLELEDTEKAREMTGSGLYQRIDRRGKVRVNSQEELCRLAVAAVSDPPSESLDFRFVPINKPDSDD